MFVEQVKEKLPYLDWETLMRINRGWSSDKKYKVRALNGKNCLLRLADADRFELKKKEYEIIRKFAAIGIPMSRPLAFGLCEKAVFILLSWVEGEDLESVLPNLPEAEQYRLGREAGTILRQLHAIPIYSADLPAGTKIEKKLRQLAAYEASDVRFSGDEAAIRFVRENIDKIWREKPVYQHGDFHPGNLILQPDGSLGVIDFNRWEVGDPWEEFYKLQSFGRELSIPYAVGQIDAYFEDSVPMDFWDTLAVYVAHASLYSIKWAEKFGQTDIDGMVERCRLAFADWDGFHRRIPVWYSEHREYSDL